MYMDKHLPLMNKINLIIATTNDKKFLQMQEALKPVAKYYKFLSLKDIGYNRKIVENGKTFDKNSKIKAYQVAKYTHYQCVADDSGLCVAALNNRPGIYTSRFGEGLSRKQQLEKMLKLMVNKENRKAKFVCSITWVIPKLNNKKWTYQVIQTKGELHGKLAHKIVNLNDGLLYDPIFIPNNFNKTMSTMSTEQKLKINHRGIAFDKMLSIIKKIWHQ